MNNAFNQDSFSSVQCDIWCIQWSLVLLENHCHKITALVAVVCHFGAAATFTHEKWKKRRDREGESTHKCEHWLCYALWDVVHDALVKVLSQVQFSKISKPNWGRVHTALIFVRVDVNRFFPMNVSLPEKRSKNQSYTESYQRLLLNQANSVSIALHTKCHPFIRFS